MPNTHTRLMEIVARWLPAGLVVVLAGCAGQQANVLQPDGPSATGATPQVVGLVDSDQVSGAGGDTVMQLDELGVRMIAGQPHGTGLRIDLPGGPSGTWTSQKGLTAEDVQVVIAPDGTVTVTVAGISSDPAAVYETARAMREQLAAITQLNAEVQAAQVQAARDTIVALIEAAKAAATGGASLMVPAP